MMEIAVAKVIRVWANVQVEETGTTHVPVILAEVGDFFHLVLNGYMIRK